MNRTIKLLGILLLSLGQLSVRAQPPTETPAAFSPGEVWRDTQGKAIQAHHGGVLYHEGLYYWYGADMSAPTRPRVPTSKPGDTNVDAVGVRCYSSKDLYDWKNEGLALKTVPDDPRHDLHPSKVLERPHVAYNARTKKFVMWMHIDDATYKTRRVGVAVADAPAGPFKYLESVRPYGQESLDQTLFGDDDGKAYRIFSSENNQATYIALMSDDYLKHSDRFVRIFVRRPSEGDAIFKREGKYYLIVSACTGWTPNAARSAVADSIWGPWKELGNPCRGPGAEKTFRAQSTCVFPVVGKKNAFILMADRWNTKDLGDSRYVWLPVVFENGQPTITWHDHWDLGIFRDGGG